MEIFGQRANRPLHSIPKESQEMLTGYAVLIAGMVAITSGAQAACHNGTIRGDYTFTVHGHALSPDGSTSVGLIDGVGIISFDGHGAFVQEDYVVLNGVQFPGGPPNPAGFHTNEGGPYSVNADCTGSKTVVLGPGNERGVAFVISNSGRTMHGIVSSALIDGSPGRVEVYTDYERVDRKQ